MNDESLSPTPTPLPLPVLFLFCKLVSKRHHPWSLTGAPGPVPFWSSTPSCWQWVERVEKEPQLTEPASIVWQLIFCVPKHPCLLAGLGGDQGASRSHAPKVSCLCSQAESPLLFPEDLCSSILLTPLSLPPQERAHKYLAVWAGSQCAELNSLTELF